MIARERIGSSQTSSDLGEVQLEEIGDIDIIRACGIAGQQNPLGLSIWRWLVGGDRSEARRVAEALMSLGHEDRVVFTVLNHLDSNVCPTCSGRGYPVIEGTPMLGDDPCNRCSGSGRVQIYDPEACALIEMIEMHQRQVAGEIMRRLNSEMDL